MPQKIPRANFAGKFSPASKFLNQDGILFIDCLPKGQTQNAEYYSFLLVLAIEGNFKGKRPTPLECQKAGLVLLRQCSGSKGTCNPDETGLSDLPMSWLPNLFPGSGTVGQPPVPWTDKNNWNFYIFSDGLRSLLSFVGSMLKIFLVCSL